MRALATGGAGFIGFNIVECLLDPEHEPVVLDIISIAYRENLIPGVAFVTGDVRGAATGWFPAMQRDDVRPLLPADHELLPAAALPTARAC